jgi:LPPG:FO 2-phospho-L-lactate transferase
VPRVVELAGGVGGARLAVGLQTVVGEELTVVVNTGDDVERHGLAIWPDHDTVLYTLAGLNDETRGWGLVDETWTVTETLLERGVDAWFRLGDRDIATHLVRTERLREGCRPTEVAAELGRSLGVDATVLPMTDNRVRTEVRTDDGWLSFQDYFVRLGQRPTVHEVRFDGIDGARMTPEASAAIEAADVIVIAPSNPIVSTGPILALPGMRDALAGARARGVPIVAVSGIVGGRALKGPADRMLVSLGHEASARGVAAIYAEITDAFVLDEVDGELEPAIAALGLRTLVTDTIMTDGAARARLAREILDFAEAA